MINRPPKWMMKFFRWFCREDLADAVEGDLLENYQRNVLNNRAKANFRFMLGVLRFFQPMMIKNKKRGVEPTILKIFTSNFKFFWRSLSSQSTNHMDTFFRPS
jgi:putative ABC transport system permease protein